MILLSPGPVVVDEEILLAQAKEMITHRSEEFSQLYEHLIERMKSYLPAEQAFILTGSGTLGIEALILNSVKKNEKMLVLSNGEFGNRLAETASVYTNVQVEKLPAGKGWNLERAREHIDNSDAQFFAIVHNETGYAVRNHIKEICSYATAKGKYVLVDAVSAWPGSPIYLDEYGVDFYVTGSQKGPGAPPGVALLWISKAGWERIESMESIPSVYCNLKKHKVRYDKSKQTPNTPAVSIFYALKKSFELMDARGGIEQEVQRHVEISEYVRKRLKEMNLELIAEEGFESYTLTAFRADNAGEIKKKLWEKYKIKIVGCKGEFKENGLRIAHMGNFRKSEINIALDLLPLVRG